MTSQTTEMELDNNPLYLKRSSSAPMINDINPSPPQTPLIRESGGGGRARRFSASFSPVGGGGSPKLTPRVNQLRREESSLDSLIGREAAHEKELHSAILISQSWEDLTLVNDNKCDVESVGGERGSSPSRSPFAIRHTFSPSIFKSSLSPSPTRKFHTRRSESPIAMRPSQLGPLKRKFELDEGELESAKRRTTLPSKCLKEGSEDGEGSDGSSTV